MLLFARTFLCLAAACVITSACVDPFGWGTQEADTQLLSEVPRFQHLAEALETNLSLEDIWHGGDSLPFDRAPDPTAWLQEVARSQQERSSQGGVPLRLLTFNVALLDAKVLGFIDYARTPFLAERRADLPDLVLERGFDVVFLQEVWLEEDVSRFESAAEQHGYRSFKTARTDYNDGLLLMVRRSAIASIDDVTHGGEAYFAQNGSEHFPGPGIKRGYQWARFEHPSLGVVVAFNTHMQAFVDNWKNRISQSRELGIAIRGQTVEGELAFVAGDLNAAPYYRTDQWEMPDGNMVTSWWENTISYPVLLEYGNLVDLAVSGRSEDEAASDVTWGDTVVNDPSRATDVPGASDDFCDGTPHTTFSATDCNSLYFAQYAGTEPAARLDHIHAHDPMGRIKVRSTRLEFTEKLRFGDIDSEPSDHYGVSVDVEIDGQP